VCTSTTSIIRKQPETHDDARQTHLKPEFLDRPGAPVSSPLCWTCHTYRVPWANPPHHDCDDARRLNPSRAAAMHADDEAFRAPTSTLRASFQTQPTRMQRSRIPTKVMTRSVSQLETRLSPIDSVSTLQRVDGSCPCSLSREHDIDANLTLCGSSPSSQVPKSFFFGVFRKASTFLKWSRSPPRLICRHLMAPTLRFMH
jgi:hypothetical protein